MNFFDRVWKEAFPDNVIHISMYKYERTKRHGSLPNIPIQFFSEKRKYDEVIAYFIAKKDELQRKEHNKQVLERFKNSQPPIKGV